MVSTIPTDSNIYYHGDYWNDIPEVIAYMHKKFSGDPEVSWISDFKNRYAHKPFKHALFLCCGNGWLEREFIDEKIVKKATAFDYSQDLLDQALKAKGNRDISYFQADVNTIEFEENQFDLIVNCAALHHVQYIDRLMKVLLKSCQSQGYFLNFDYIGPSRNQYGAKQWKHIINLNKQLPEYIRHGNLHYPHLPTMLVSDPTEAIHSALIIPTMTNYFKLIEKNDTNGGLAYMLLTHNKKIKNLHPKLRKYWVKQILLQDNYLTNMREVPVMFSYFIAKPNKKILKNRHLLTQLRQIEESRENKAADRLGTYSLPDYLLVKYNPFIHQSKARLSKLFRYILSKQL